MKTFLPTNGISIEYTFMLLLLAPIYTYCPRRANF